MFKKILSTVKNPKVWVPFAIILSAVAITAILSALRPKPLKAPVEKPVPVVEVLPIEVSEVFFSVLTQGNVTAKSQTSLTSEVSGRVKWVSPKFNVGGYFEKDELMLEIDPISYEVALLQAQARLDAARARHIEEQARAEQAEKEWKMTGRPLKDAPILALRVPQLKQAEADVKAAEADVKNAEIKLARTKISAPYAAMVAQKQVDIGQFVSTGTPLAQIFSVSEAEIRLPVKPLDLEVVNLPSPKANKLDNIKVELDVRIGKQQFNLPARLVRHEGTINQSTRVSYLVAQVDDPYSLHAEKPVLPVGAFVSAKLTSMTPVKALALPRALLHRGDTLYLMTPENKLLIKKVSPLRSEYEMVYFSPDSLPLDHRVVVTNLASPVNGMSLQVIGQNNDLKKPTQEDRQGQASIAKVQGGR